MVWFDWLSIMLLESFLMYRTTFYYKKSDINELYKQVGLCPKGVPYNIRFLPKKSKNTLKMLKSFVLFSFIFRMI